MAELKGEPSAWAADLAVAEARVSRVNLALRAGASEVTRLRRMYVWSVEFGLLADDVSVHGAALLSSPTEFRSLLAGRAKFAPYSLDVIDHENSFSDMVNYYFVAADFSAFRTLESSFPTEMREREWRPLTVSGSSRKS